jgi:hypothetical protein
MAVSLWAELNHTALRAGNDAMVKARRAGAGQRTSNSP